MPTSATMMSVEVVCAQNCRQGSSEPFLPPHQMIQVPKPMLRLGLRFPGETLLCLAEIIHTSTECSLTGFRTLKSLSNPCGPSPCGRLSPPLTTMAAPTPSRHLNRSLSSPLQGGRLGLPRSLSDTLHRKVGLSCTPVRCPLTASPVAAGFYLFSHCRFAPMDRLFTGPRATDRLPTDFHPIPIVFQGVDPLGASDRGFLRDLVPAQAGSLGVVMEYRPVPRVFRASDGFWLAVPRLPNQPQQR